MASQLPAATLLHGWARTQTRPRLRWRQLRLVAAPTLWPRQPPPLPTLLTPARPPLMTQQQQLAQRLVQHVADRPVAVAAARVAGASSARLRQPRRGKTASGSTRYVLCLATSLLDCLVMLLVLLLVLLFLLVLLLSYRVMCHAHVPLHVMSERRTVRCHRAQVCASRRVWQPRHA